MIFFLLFAYTLLDLAVACQARRYLRYQASELDYLYFARDTEQQARRAGDSGSPMLNIGACCRSVKQLSLISRLLVTEPKLPYFPVSKFWPKR